MSWMVTERYSDVASCPTRGRRAALLSVARLQSAGVGSGLETKRRARGEVLADYSSLEASAATAAAVSHIYWYTIPR